jgi:pimeloyl-ACP methyl ester carboxylesterase
MLPRYAIDKTLTVNELRFHYRDWNGHGWPVLLLHGLSSTSHVWDLTAPLLVDEARVIALDLRGHGQSDKPDGDYGYETIVADVRAVLAALHYERPVIAGHSWGAGVGLWLAAHYPDEVAGLVLVDGGLGDLSTVMSWEETLKLLRPPDIDGTPVEELRQMILEHTPDSMLTPEVEAVVMANFQIDAAGRIRRRLPVEYHLRILRSIWETRKSDLLPRIACPVLAIMARWEGRDDPKRLELKVRGAKEAGEVLADVEVIWFDETVHDVPLHRPQKLADTINTFLRERV